MADHKLSLRQRKILYMVQHHSGYITSRELAGNLKVSSRTIRNEIKEINQILEPYHASVVSTQSKGFLFQAENPEEIREIIRIDTAFFTKAERIRYLTLRLCQSENPLNLYDLEDEIFVSRTALVSDIRRIRQKYSFEPPYIKVILHRDEVSFEKNELKIRSVLLNLFHEDWDYHAQGNAYYGFHFLDEELLALLTANTSEILYRHGIRMDDPTLIALELSIAIMHYRFLQGHPYPDGLTLPAADSPVKMAQEEIFRIVEDKTGQSYPDSEKARVCEFIMTASLTGARIQDAGEEKQDDCGTRDMVSMYLNDIREIFGVDFTNDAEFLKTLNLLFMQLKNGDSIFSQHQDFAAIKSMYSAEYELAWLIERRAEEFFERFLGENEICTLAICLSGAIRHYLSLHPEKKLRAVLFSHRNMAAAWALKRKIQESFSLYLEVRDVLPVNFKDNYDFTETDLILTTVKKRMADSTCADIIYIDDSPEGKTEANAEQIKSLSFKKIWPMPFLSLSELLAEGYWYENREVPDSISAIQQMIADFRAEGTASEQHLLDITWRESHSSFAVRPGIVFLYSTVPAEKTGFSVMTFRHRTRWGDFRVSTAVMALFSEKDLNLLFHLKVLFCSRPYDAEKLQILKTKDELLPYLLE